MRLARQSAMGVAVLALFLFAAPSANANACASNATGNWGTAGTWSNCGGVIPTSTDSVEISRGNTVTVNVANAVAASVKVGRSVNSGAGTLVFNSGSQLTVTGSVTLGSTVNSGDSGTITMTSGGTLSAGSLALGISTTKTWTPGTGTVVLTATNTLPASTFTSFNNLTITAGTTTVGVSTTVNGALTVSAGTFTVGAFTLSVTGPTTVTGTLSITNTAGTKTFGDLIINGTFTNTTVNEAITINGNLQNNGTFSQGTGRVTFTGAASNTVTGTAATTAFGGGITVNKGVSNLNVLDVQSVITMAAGGLTLTNGTFKLTSASTITPFTVDIGTSPFLIPATAGLWCNGGTISASANIWTIAGLVRISAGTLNVGTVANDRIIPQSGASIIIEGGTTSIAARISANGMSWTYSMTGGTLILGTVGSTDADRPIFNMDVAGCSFSMSGGTMIIRRQGGTAGQNLGFNNLATAGTGFTGGTLQIGDASTPAAQTIGIVSTRPIYNLTVNSANATALLQTSALTVTNDVTISAGILNANNLGLSVGGNWTNNASTTAFTAGTATVTLNGTVAQSIGGSFATTFNNLIVSNTGNTVTSNVNSSVAGNLSVSSGTFDLGTFTANRASAGGTLTVSNGATLKIGGTNTVPSNYSAHVIGATSTVEYSGTNQSLAVLNSAQDYGHLTISGSGTKTLAGSENVRGTLTFTGGTITTGASTLYLTSTGTVSRTSGHVIGNFKKNVATGATSRTFEVGDATNYTPVTVAFASVTTAGDLTASVASGDHANIGTSTINAALSVNRNWTLTNTGIVFTNYGATFTFVAGDLDAGATTSNFFVGRYSAGWTYPTVGTKTSTTTQATGLTLFGDFQLGEVVPKTWDGGAGTNNWGDAANWNTDGVPISTDNVDLTGANTININVAAVANNILLNNAGLILTINSGNSLAVSGALTLTSGTFNMGTNTVSGAGSFTVGAGGNLGIGSTAGITSAGASGNVQVTGTRTFSTAGNYTYNGTSAQVTGNGLPATVNNLTINNSAGVTLSATVAVSSNLTVTAGTLDLGSFTANRASAGGTLTVSDNATLKIGGTNTFPTNYATNTLGAASTVEYSGTNQTVANQTYGNLKLSSSSGAAVKTLPGTALAVAGNLSSVLGAGTSVTFTAASNITVNGDVSIGASTTFNGGSYSNSVGGNWVNDGTFNGDTGTIIMSGASKTLSGAGTKSFAGLSVTGSITTDANFSISTSLSVNGSLSASAGTATFTGTSTLSGTANLFNTTINGTSLQLSGNSTLGIANVMTITAGTLDVTSTAPNTVNYNGTGAQNINPITYHDLTLSNGSNKTAVAGITVNETITIATGTTFIPGAFTHSIYGDWNNNGSFTAGSSTIQFVGNPDSNINGATTFNILGLNKSIATSNAILQNNVSASTVNMTLGTMLTGTNTLTITTTRTGNGKILGNIQRNHSFTTGIAYAFETPNNTITFSSVSSVNSITVSIMEGGSTGFPFGSSINEEYTITVPAGTYNATLRLDYDDDELNGVDESTMTLWNYNGTSWDNLGRSANDTSANYVELDGLTNITNSWTLSDYSSGTNVVRWNGSVSTDWNTADNWTIVQGSASRPPTAADIVELGTAAFTYQPTISSAVSVRDINFGSVQAVTLSMASGGSLTSGNISGTWSSSVTHTINANDQSITTNGGFVLSDGVSGHVIDLNIGSGTVNVALALTQSGGANIVFSGAGNLNIAEDFNYISGTFTPGTGTVTYDGSSDQAVAAVSYNNLTINNTAAAEAIINNPITVGGNLTITAGELDNLTTTTILGNVVISSGATLHNDGIFHIGGNWTNNGTYMATGASIYFDGSGTQTISASTFNNLIINKPVGSSAELTGNLVMNGDLTVTSGTLNLKTFDCNRSVAGGTLTLADSATLIFGGNNIPANFSSVSLANASTVIADGTVAQTISGSSFGHLVFRNAGAKTLVSPITVNGDLTVESGSNFDGGNSTHNLLGTVTNNGTITSTGTLNFVPPSAATVNLGSNFSSTGTVVFGGAGAMTLAGTPASFHHVVISSTNGAGIAPSSDWNITNNFTVNSGSMLNAGSYSYLVGGDVSNNGTITSGTSTFTLNGTSPQDIYAASAFNNLTIDNSAGSVTLSSNATVNGVLNFVAGKIQTGSNRLIQPSSGSVTGAAQSTGWVYGSLQKNIATGATSKTFEVGDAGSYTPATIAFGSVSTAGDLTARVVSGDHANIGTSTINAAKSVNRNWTLTNSGIAFTNYDATFAFVAGDVDGGASTSAFIVGDYNGGWAYPTVGTRTSTATQATGLTAFGDFQLGEAAPLPPDVPLVNSVTPSGTQPPGTDLVYTVVFTNGGGQAAQVFIVVDPIPLNTDFKLGSPDTVLGTTGMTVAIAYSNDNEVSYTYTPVSAGGGAPAGYDRAVTHIRWTFTGNLSQTSPNNSGSISFTARIR